MKIAYILSSTTPLGGASKSFKTMLSGLMKFGVEPVIIVPDKKGLYKEFKKQGISVYALRYKLNIYPELGTLKKVIEFIPRIIVKYFLNTIASHQLAAILCQEHADIVHTNVGVINIGFAASRKALLSHIYHIREYGDLDFNMNVFPSKKNFQKELNMSQSYTICITRDIQQYYQQTGKDTSRVIYNGIKPAMNGCVHNKKKDYLLYAGRIEPAKGLYELLVAYADYLKKTPKAIPLYITGIVHDENYWKDIQVYIQESQLEKLVRYLGQRSDIEIIMQQARAIIIPSHFEGFGRCMPEAMFNGCLSIGRNTGGTKEQLDNGLRLQGNEIALRYDTTSELTQFLCEISQSPIAHYQPMIERAFQTVNQLYTEENNARETYQFYQTILKADKCL